MQDKKTYLHAGRLLVFVLAMTMAACKDSIDIGRMDNEAKLVVYCFPTVGDTTYISVSRSLPVQGYRDTVRLSGLGGATVGYQVNATPLRVDDLGAGRYRVVGHQQAGDRITVTVGSEGLPAATATTTIPDTVRLSEGARREVRLYDSDWEESVAYEQLMATFTDPSAGRDCYAAQVQVRKTFADEPDGDSTATDCRYTVVSALEVNTKSEPLLLSLTDIDDDFGFSNDYFGRLYIFDDTSVNGQSYTLHLNVDISDVTDGAALETRERVSLLHLTPEYYHFLRSINAADNSDLARYGLSQLMPTASNVEGGLGVVGGWNASHTQWMNRYEEQEP